MLVDFANHACWLVPGFFLTYLAQKSKSKFTESITAATGCPISFARSTLDVARLIGQSWANKTIVEEKFRLTHLKREKTMSLILVSSSDLGWITAIEINHS